MTRAEQQFKKFTLEEKIGQLIIIRSLYCIESTEEMLEKGLLGGVGAMVIRQVSKNFQNTSVLKGSPDAPAHYTPIRAKNA